MKPSRSYISSTFSRKERASIAMPRSPAPRNSQLLIGRYTEPVIPFTRIYRTASNSAGLPLLAGFCTTPSKRTLSPTFSASASTLLAKYSCTTPSLRAPATETGATSLTRANARVATPCLWGTSSNCASKTPFSPLHFGFSASLSQVMTKIPTESITPTAPAPNSQRGAGDSIPAASRSNDTTNKVAVCSTSTLHSHPVTMPATSGNASLSRG